VDAPAQLPQQAWWAVGLLRSWNRSTTEGSRICV